MYSIPGKQVLLNLFSYNETSLKHQLFANVAEARGYMDSHPEEKHWLQIIGYGNTDFFNDLKDHFEIHPLELEDILSSNARPKMEIHQGKVFDISRMLHYNEELHLMDEQFNLFYTDN